MIDRIVTVRLGGPDNPVLVQGIYLSDEKGLTSVEISPNVIVRGKLIPSVRIMETDNETQ